VLDAGFWALVAASTLLVGAAGPIFGRLSRRAIALSAAFGGAALISVLAFNLDEHAYELAGAGGAVSGFVAGALAFFVADRVLANQRRALRRAIALGAALDAVPESVLIAFTIVEGGDVGGAVVAAVFLSNIGESLAVSARMRNAGLPEAFVRRLWIGVMLVAGTSAVVGYALFNNASAGVQGFGHAFATGAAMCMLAETILPEAFRRDEPLVGIVVALGFILGFGLSLA